jgi:hypothetical protein
MRAVNADSRFTQTAPRCTEVALGLGTNLAISAIVNTATANVYSQVIDTSGARKICLALRMQNVSGSFQPTLQPLVASAKGSTYYALTGEGKTLAGPGAKAWIWDIASPVMRFSIGSASAGKSIKISQVCAFLQS